MELRCSLLRCTRNLCNQGGFTLIESLLALFTSSLVLLLVGMTFQMLVKTENYMNNSKNNIEWHLFLNQTEYDMQNKKLTKVHSYEITLEEQGTRDVISYAQNGSKIRWQRNKVGYVPVLTNVKEVNFQNNASGLLIEVTFTNQQNVKGLIPLGKE